MGVGGDMIRCQPYFSTKSGSVARVWAAFRERSYEEGPTKWEVHSKYDKKCLRGGERQSIAKADVRSTTNFAKVATRVKKCLGWHFECCARRVPTLKKERNT